MGKYEKDTIKNIIEKIKEGKVFLPALQRKYVWAEDRVTKFMDSVMKNYPIGTFLFWKVKNSVINEKEYSMYEFIRDYHQRDFFKNKLAAPPTNPDNSIWAVLDGQQRLTSLYIALQGSISNKIPNKQWKNDDAFPKKELYFNIHSQINDEDSFYEFEFLTADAAKSTKNNQLWYRVKDILKYKFEELYSRLFIPNNLLNDSVAIDNLSKLHTRLFKDELINYYEEEADSIDNVLEIFVRVNSGGMVLSKSDLLFSTIVSHWDDAREEIDSLLTAINKIGEGYKFTNDFIMRTCLYLIDDLSVSLKVEAFKRDKVLKIKDNWNSIKNSIKTTVNLLNDYGFNAENIISYVSIIPVVYYIYKGGKLDELSKNELKKYIVISQVKQIFGASTNTALTNIKKFINTEKSFELSDLYGIRFTGEKTLKYTSEEIDGLFDTHEIGAYTFMLLSLLYPNLKYSQKPFHQDHMHPKSWFENDKIKDLILPNGAKIDNDTIVDWQRKRNTLANLQMLEGRENESKNDTPLVEWLKIPSNKENVKYLPQNISYELSNFEEFMEERKKLMSSKLKEILL